MTQDLRPPSFMERYQLCRVDNKYYPNFNVTVKYASSINSTVLAHAVHNIIVKNPLLDATILEPPKAMIIMITETIPFVL